MRRLLSLSFLLTGCLVGFSLSAQAQQELVERSFTGTSKSLNAVEARREIQDQAAVALVEEFAKELLGEEKYLKNQSLLTGKVAKAQGRFIPFLKPGKLESLPDGFRLSLQLKMDLKAFRQVLQENALLNENETSPVLLPMVSWVDQIHLRSERWWSLPSAEFSSPLPALSRQLEVLLQAQFLKNGFHVVRPSILGYANGFPQALRGEKPTPDDLFALGSWYGVPLIIEGQIRLARHPVSSNLSRVEVKLAVVQTSNGRTLADVTRSQDLDAKTLETSAERKLKEILEPASADLASQVFEAWQKGSVGSSQLKLSFDKRLPLPEIEQLKDRLKNGPWGIRAVKERLITGDLVQFEIETPLTAEELAGRLGGSVELIGRKWKAASVSDQEIKMEALR